jgi:hypothetical protein
VSPWGAWVAAITATGTMGTSTAVMGTATTTDPY